MKRMVAILSHYNSRRNKIINNICVNLDALNIPYCVVVPQSVSDDALSMFKNVFKYNDTDTISKVKNDIIRKYKGLAHYLHIIEDDMILSNGQYILNAEEMMEFLNIPIISATTVENQNRVCGILTPRVRIKDLEKPFNEIEFYSTEAKCYICINLYDMPARFEFNESYTYFYLGHNYWKRHHTDGSVPFLNFYPSIKDEDIMLHRDFSIKSHLTNEHIKQATAEIKDSGIRWEADSSIDGPVNYIINSLNAYRRTHRV